ncbi:MAG TPA: sulfotransferase [Solirubrobacteraceae bacterium]|nr:sulfotransferase [Solirubrobacteraceae bacterium]
MTPPAPIFVGGTGRSGTTILARLIGRHPDHEVIPVEARFHCSPDGLPGVLDGSVTPEQFVQHMRTQWYHPPGRSPKLGAFVERAAFDGALARFLQQAEADKLAAGRALVDELFGAYAHAKHKRGWVEMTPINAMWGAPSLARLFPELKLVHVLRDGRDVASSLVSLGWMASVPEALQWWEERMLKAHEACATLLPQSLLVIHFEALLVEDRAGTLQRLCSFMGWPPEPLLERFMERRMPPQDAHVGRWRTHCSAQEQAFLRTEYPACLSRLAHACVSAA